MENTNRQEFARIMTGIAELFGKPMSKDLMEIYWMACVEMPIQAFREAATKAAKSCEFIPKPVDFLKQALEYELTALEAWAQAVGSFSGMRSPPNSVRDKAVDMIGGWNMIGQCNYDKLPFLEKRFCEAYETALERVPTSERIAMAMQYAALDAPEPALLERHG